MTFMSRHVSRRIQKRSVPLIVLDWLRDYGTEQYDGQGAVIRYFDSAAKERLAQVCGRRFVQSNKKYLSVYMVEDTCGESLITVGYRHRRISRR